MPNHETPIMPGEAHMLLVLLVDTSGSMSDYGKMQSVNEGCRRFLEDAPKDEHTRNRLEVCVIEFNDRARLVADFTPVCSVVPPVFEAAGLTHMGEGINMAIDKLRDRITFLDGLGVPLYKPWIFMITDGEPYGESSHVIEDAIRRVKLETEKDHLKFFSLGVDDANDTQLKRFSDYVFRLQGYNFTNMFDWLTKSMAKVTDSLVNTQVALTKPDDVIIV